MTERAAAPAEGDDERFMAAALRLGARALGRAFPNPAVGCVIVRGGNIIGRGFTRAGGRPHAEAVALDEAGQAARGATLYATLEPCAHHGKTPPCAQAIIEAGIARVVSALEDPDPRVAGKGHDLLRAAGIAVRGGVLGAAAARAHRGHIMRVRHGRPYIQLKLAHARDGMIAKDGKPVKITGALSDGYVHRMRAQADAILIGFGTAAADDPLLTCRLPGADDRSPIRIVLDSGLWSEPRLRLVADARHVPTWIVTGRPAAADRAGLLTNRGVEIIEVARQDERVDLVAALAAMATRGITRVMVEGGATLARAVVEAGLVDEAVFIGGDLTIGKGGLPAFGDAGPEFLTKSGAFNLVEKRFLERDLLRRYERAPEAVCGSISSARSPSK